MRLLGARPSQRRSPHATARFADTIGPRKFFGKFNGHFLCFTADSRSACLLSDHPPGPARQLADGGGDGGLCLFDARSLARRTRLEDHPCPAGVRGPGRGRGTVVRRDRRRQRGGSRWGAVLALPGSVLGSLLGIIVGLPVPLVGSILAAVLFAALGAIVGEILVGGKMDATWQIAKQAFWGRLAGTAGKLLLGAMMVAFVVAALPTRLRQSSGARASRRASSRCFAWAARRRSARSSSSRASSATCPKCWIA